MKRLCGWSVLMCLLTGCIGHNLANVCDSVKPGKFGPNEVPPYGGVWVQQQTITPLSAPPPPPFPPPAGGGFVPPPMPLPGSVPSTGFQLQPPLPPTPPPFK